MSGVFQRVKGNVRGVQGKVISSLQIHDLARKGKDIDGLEPGGRRRVILLAAASGVKESRDLTDRICQSLKLATVTHSFLCLLLREGRRKTTR